MPYPVRTGFHTPCGPRVTSERRPNVDAPARESYAGGMGFLARMGSWLEGGDGLADPAEIHITQIGDEVYNAHAPGATANCGPSAVIMAMRLVGAAIPGEDRYHGEELISHVRQLATGEANRLRGTTAIHLLRVLRLAGCEGRQLTHTKDMLRAVTRGEPVIMGGNPAVPGTYTERFDYLDIRRYDSGHWIVVSRFNPETRNFIVNDPQSTIGPIEATVDELYRFSSRDGGIGLAVRRA